MFRLAPLLLLLCSFGCSGQEAQVSGTVTLDGKEIGPGMIGFEPSGAGKMATGLIEKDGSYMLKTNRESGLMPGEYRVYAIINEGTAQEAPLGQRIAAGKSLIPIKYSASATSGLTVNVAPGSNKIPIELVGE